MSSNPSDAMEKVVARTAAALLVGNELLSGKVADLNLAPLARTLQSLGIGLERVSVVPDQLELLIAEIRVLARDYDVVFTSGGVGPTHDDVTIAAVAGAFGVGTGVHPLLAARIRSAYGDRCTEEHLRLAIAPEGARLAPSPEGAWPTPVMNNVWMLPGVPEAFREKLATVREWVRGPSAFVSRAVITRLDEVGLLPLLDALVASHPAVAIGSYPRWFEPSYKTKVTFDSRDARAVDAAVRDFLDRLPPDATVRVE